MGAPKLTKNNIETAIKLLDGWSDKLTWDRYLAILEVEIGHLYTKGAMQGHPRIIEAWNLAKSRVRDSYHGAAHGNIGLAQATNRIRQLNDRVERLENENNKLLEQFVRWSHNAAIHGISFEDLDRPLPN